jgi:arginyl-tRNA synthetase
VQLFQVQLVKAIHIALGVNYSYAEIPVKPYFTKQSQTYQNNTYHYTSPIALSLAHQLGRSPLEVARDMNRVMDGLGGGCFAVAVGSEGWLNFRLSDRLIADSLLALSQDLQSGEITALPSRPQNFPGYTYVQYAHARCSALLRLAQSQGLIGNPRDFSWQLLAPTGNLYLRESTEMRLVSCLVTLACEVEPGVNEIITPQSFPSGSAKQEQDGSYAPALFNYEGDRGLEADAIMHVSPWLKGLDCKVAIKLSKNLATNFLSFYDSCQITSVGRDLGMARTGLVATTQKAIARLASGLIVLPELL